MKDSLTAKTLTYALAILALCGCAKQPVSTMGTNNRNVGLSLMFEYDGCKVYRFEDAGYFRYFTDCRGAVLGGENHSCGKNCTSFVPNDVETSR